VSTPNIVNSCSVDQSLKIGVCTSNTTDIYLVDLNVAKPGSTPSATLTSAGTGTVKFTGGSATTGGVVVDSSRHSAVISVSLAGGTSGYQLLDLTNNQLSAPIVATGSEVAESFGLAPSLDLILSATESVSGPPATYQLFRMVHSKSPEVFNFAGAGTAFPTSANLDSGVVDSSGILLATVENTTKMFVADLTRVTFDATTKHWDAPNQLQDLGPSFKSFSDGLTGIAIANGSHQALLADEFGTTAFAAIQLPSTAGSGTPAVQDWAVASMPNDPKGAAWQMPEDPHGLSAAFVSRNGSDKGIGVLMDLSRTYVAEIDLAALLAAKRSADMHTVDSGVDLRASGVLTFLPIQPPAGITGGDGGGPSMSVPVNRASN
jgi:hypothetical protein